MSQTVTMLRVSGMTCSNCVRHVGEVLRAISGVASVEVTLETSSVQVDWKVGATANDSALISALKKAGYSLSLIHISEPTRQP
jgi:copper chaperone CopZ